MFFMKKKNFLFFLEFFFSIPILGFLQKNCLTKSYFSNTAGFLSVEWESSCKHPWVINGYGGAGSFSLEKHLPV